MQLEHLINFIVIYRFLLVDFNCVEPKSDSSFYWITIFQNLVDFIYFLSEFFFTLYRWTATPGQITFVRRVTGKVCANKDAVLFTGLALENIRKHQRVVLIFIYKFTVSAW